jgi:hypothetical protein
MKIHLEAGGFVGRAGGGTGRLETVDSLSSRGSVRRYYIDYVGPGDERSHHAILRISVGDPTEMVLREVDPARELVLVSVGGLGSELVEKGLLDHRLEDEYRRKIHEKYRVDHEGEKDSR